MDYGVLFTFLQFQKTKHIYQIKNAVHFSSKYDYFVTLHNGL